MNAPLPSSADPMSKASTPQSLTKITFGSSGFETELPPQKEGDHPAARSPVSSASEYLLPQEAMILGTTQARVYTAREVSPRSVGLVNPGCS
uniref:Uncharacterized protein n=1 Tax=Peronospora matthiolae TaxID=2874970 RepID=A0AAV1TNV9_9STRA